MLNTRPLAGLMTAAALFTAMGCDGKPAVDTSHVEATVKGIVKIDGVPATGGEISFDPANYRRKDVTPRTAAIGKDGSYTIKTLTGTNQVKLGGSIVKKNLLLERVSRSLDVQSGENTFDFEAKGR